MGRFVSGVVIMKVAMLSALFAELRSVHIVFVSGRVRMSVLIVTIV